MCLACVCAVLVVGDFITPTDRMANLLQPQMTGTGHRYGHLLPPESRGDRVIKGAKLSYAGRVCVCVSIDPLINFMKHSNIDHKIGVPLYGQV